MIIMLLFFSFPLFGKSCFFCVQHLCVLVVYVYDHHPFSESIAPWSIILTSGALDGSSCSL